MACGVAVRATAAGGGLEDAEANATSRSAAYAASRTTPAATSRSDRTGTASGYTRRDRSVLPWDALVAGTSRSGRLGRRGWRSTMPDGLAPTARRRPLRVLGSLRSPPVLGAPTASPCPRVGRRALPFHAHRPHPGACTLQRFPGPTSPCPRTKSSTSSSPSRR